MQLNRISSYAYGIVGIPTSGLLVVTLPVDTLFYGVIMSPLNQSAQFMVQCNDPTLGVMSNMQRLLLRYMIYSTAAVSLNSFANRLAPVELAMYVTQSLERNDWPEQVDMDLDGFVTGWTGFGASSMIMCIRRYSLSK